MISERDFKAKAAGLPVVGRRTPLPPAAGCVPLSAAAGIVAPSPPARRYRSAAAARRDCAFPGGSALVPAHRRRSPGGRLAGAGARRPPAERSDRGRLGRRRAPRNAEFVPLAIVPPPEREGAVALISNHPPLNLSPLARRLPREGRGCHRRNRRDGTMGSGAAPGPDGAALGAERGGEPRCGGEERGGGGRGAVREAKPRGEGAPGPPGTAGTGRRGGRPRGCSSFSFRCRDEGKSPPPHRLSPHPA